MTLKHLGVTKEKGFETDDFCNPNTKHRSGESRGPRLLVLNQFRNCILALTTRETLVPAMHGKIGKIVFHAHFPRPRRSIEKILAVGVLEGWGWKGKG